MKFPKSRLGETKKKLFLLQMKKKKIDTIFYRTLRHIFNLEFKKKKSDYFFRRYLACYNTYIKFNQK